MHVGLGIDARTRVLLVMFANDALLEGQIWPGRHQFAGSLGLWRPDAVAVPDFSVWLHDSWLERQFAIVRSLRFFELLQEHGITAVPHVFWGDPCQLQEWVSWIRTNPVEWIAMDVQCLQPALRPMYLAELREFREALGVAPRLLVGGTSDAQWMRSLRAVWPGAAFTANVSVLAHKRRYLLPHRDGSVARVVWGGADPADLLVREVERLEGILSEELTFPWATASQDAWTARWNSGRPVARRGTRDQRYVHP
jgi:hypothetical protein